MSDGITIVSSKSSTFLLSSSIYAGHALQDTLNSAVDQVVTEIAPRLQEASWWPTGTYTHPQNGALAEWTLFEPVQLKRPSLESRRVRNEAAGIVDVHDNSYIEECSAFANSRYCVLIHDVPPQPGRPALWHLLIQRRDGRPVGAERYGDFMRLRDELIGEGHEAAEIYPARSREVDVANVYHLWVVQSEMDEFPFGFK